MEPTRLRHTLADMRRLYEPESITWRITEVEECLFSYRTGSAPKRLEDTLYKLNVLAAEYGRSDD